MRCLENAGVGLVFPRSDRPIAVEFPGYPVVRLRPIEGLEFVEEAVIALGSSTELATHLFRECWAPRIQGRDGGRPGGALAVGRLHQSCRTFLTADDRVEKVAAFVAQHFKEKVLPLGYKAFRVGVNREACAKYKRALDKLLPPEWSEAVYTESAADIIDRPLVAELQLSSGREADVRLLFKKPTENPKILIGRSRGSSSWRRRSPPWDPRPSSPPTCSGSAGRHAFKVAMAADLVALWQLADYTNRVAPS